MLVKMKAIFVDRHSTLYKEPTTTTLRHRDIQEESLLYILPRELLEIITQFLDSVSAIRLACTCAKFYNIINETAHWKKYVCDEIVDIRELLDLGLHFGVPLWRQTSCYAPWRQIVHGRFICKSIKKWNYTLAFETTISRDEITSVCIAGQSVVFGTCRGGLALWNPDQSGPYIHPILHSSAEIDQVFVHLSPGSEDGHFQYQVVVHSIDTAIIIYDLSGYTLVSGVSKMRDLNKISYHGDTLVEWDPIRGNNAETIIGEKVVKRCANYRNMRTQYGPFVAVDVSENLFISQSKGPLIYGASSHRNIPITELLSGASNTLNIARAFIWPGRISFSISGRVTIISVGGKCKAIRWPPVFRCVTATLFANVLAVGTDVGQVLFYTFKTPLQLLNLDPLNYEKSLSIGTAEPIIYVGFRMQNRLHELPDVVAATCSNLFCFRAV